MVCMNSKKNKLVENREEEQTLVIRLKKLVKLHRVLFS